MSVSVALAWSGAALAAEPAETLLREISVNQSEQRRALLRDEVAPVESCRIEDVLATGATNLNEALDKRPGVAVQVECSICNARFISLNNLPGRYTTLLIDGVPLFSSVSQAYGLDSVGLRGLERIDLMRGAGASGLTGEALAGTVNLVTRKPEKDEAMVEIATGMYGHRRIDAQMASAGERGALIANLHYNNHDSVDGDGNGVSEYAGYERILGGLGYFLNDVGGFALRGRTDIISEKRGGGALGRDYDAIKDSRTGNPFDFSQGAHASPDFRGWIVPDGVAQPGDVTLPDGRVLRLYNDGRAGLSEIIFTDRISTYLTGEKRMGDKVLTLSGGYARHDQDSFYEGNDYDARQNQGYLGINLKTPLWGGVWTVLADWRYEDLRSKARLPDGTPADGLDNYTYRTPGIGAQAQYAFIDDRLEVAANLRADDNNVYGGQVAPRLNLLWRHDDHASSRISAGKGYRLPTSYFEQDHGILETIDIRNETTDMEVSRNLMYSFDWQDGPWKFLANAHMTRLDNLAWLDVNGMDASGNPVSALKTSTDTVKVNAADAQLGYQFNPSLSGSMALELADYRQFQPGTLAFARPEQRAYLTLDWDKNGWDVFFRATWTGAQDLAKFYYRDGQRYNFDGSPKPDRSPTFWTLDLRTQYAIDKRWALFLGVDNLTDFQQADHDGYLWIDQAGSIDVTQIWGPNRGRFVYGGVRFEM